MGIRERLFNPRHRHARRLVLVLLWLVLFDLPLPGLLRRLEHQRYESRLAFRFENSDLFGLGPLVSYLREHPRGERPRVVFLGNSMMFGYGVDPAQALPAEYERQHGGVRVLNIGVNGHELGSHYLIGKDIIDSVDRLYVQVAGVEANKANPILGSLIPVTPDDVRAFGLVAPDATEQRLQSLAGRIWRLDGLNDRLQAALFGTSTRLFLYLHKKDIALALLRPVYRRAVTDVPLPFVDAHVTLRVPHTADAVRRDQLRLLPSSPRLAFADLASSRRKRLVFLRFEYLGLPGNGLEDLEDGKFNAVYAPYVETVVVRIPRELTTDARHLTPQGAQQVAAALLQHERESQAVSR